MSGTAKRKIFVDTGFAYSVTAIGGLPPLLGERWAGVVEWPTDVRDELRVRRERPGGGLPAGLPAKTINASGLWLPEPMELSSDQQDAASLIVRQLGGLDAKQHAGEAACTVLAQDLGGVVATEDYAAAAVIRTACGVQTICVCDVLQSLIAASVWTSADVAVALNDLAALQRPNVDGLTATDIANGSWKDRLTKT